MRKTVRLSLFTLIILLLAIYCFSHMPIVKANATPVNIEMVIADMDDTDNVYAQVSYRIRHRAEDADGHANITFMMCKVKQGATLKATFAYNRTSESSTFVSEDGTWYNDSLGTGQSGDIFRVDWYFGVRWNATDEADLDLEFYVEDSLGASDNDTVTDYFDVVTDIITTFTLNPSSGSVSSSTTASGVVKYASDPDSSTQGTVLVEQAEFDMVHVYNADNEDQGNDTWVSLGEWSVIFDVPDTGGTYTYNLYINMNDTEYTDGEETSPTADFTANPIVTGPSGPSSPNHPEVNPFLVDFAVTISGDAMPDCAISIYETTYETYQGTIHTDIDGKANITLSYGEYKYEAHYEDMTLNGTFFHYGEYVLIPIEFGEAIPPITANLAKILIGVSVLAGAVYGIAKIKK